MFENGRGEADGPASYKVEDLRFISEPKARYLRPPEANNYPSGDVILFTLNFVRQVQSLRRTG